MESVHRSFMPSHVPANRQQDETSSGETVKGDFWVSIHRNYLIHKTLKPSDRSEGKNHELLGKTALLHRDTAHFVHIARLVATNHRLLSPTEVVAHIQPDGEVTTGSFVH